MELYYNLLGVFSLDESVIEHTTKLVEELIDTGYVEDNDIIELAKHTNSVVLIEVEQEDGYMEFILVNNKGRMKRKEYFSPENTYKIRDEIDKVGVEEYFSKKALKEIETFAKEYEMTRDEFIQEYLDTYLMDEYEKRKYKYIEGIEKYYID